MRHRLLETRVAYGVADRVTVFATVPLWNDRSHGQRDFERNLGVPPTQHVALTGPQALAAAATPHEQRGIGDLQIGAGFLIASGASRSLFLQTSLKAPTGSTGRRDSYGSVDRPDLQPGSGSWDGSMSLVGQHRMGKGDWSLFGGVYARLNGESGRKYRFGHEASVSLGVTSGRVGRLRPSFQIGYRATGIDHYIGRVVPSTGMRSWTVTPGLRLRAGAGAAYLYTKIPLATSVTGAQLGPRVDVLAGVSRTF